MTEEILCFYCDGDGGANGTVVVRVCAACLARIKANAKAARMRKRDAAPESSEATK